MFGWLIRLLVGGRRWSTDRAGVDDESGADSEIRSFVLARHWKEACVCMCLRNMDRCIACELSKQHSKPRLYFWLIFPWWTKDQSGSTFFSLLPLFPFVLRLDSVVMVEGHPSKTHNGSRRWMRTFVDKRLEMALRMCELRGESLLHP